MISFNTNGGRVIDDFSYRTNLCEFDYYAEQYPNSTFMVIPYGLTEEVVMKIKEVNEEKGIQIGAHGLFHKHLINDRWVLIPEGIIPLSLTIGYIKLTNEGINVEAYRPPFYVNNLIDYLFTNNLKLIYNLLNDQYSFDINWVEWYYKIYDTDKELVYNKFKKDKLLGNNLNNKSDKIFTLDPEFFIKIIKSPMINYQFRDGMIEHSFERIYLNLIATLDLNYIMIE